MGTLTTQIYVRGCDAEDFQEQWELFEIFPEKSNIKIFPDVGSVEISDGDVAVVFLELESDGENSL